MEGNIFNLAVLYKNSMKQYSWLTLYLSKEELLHQAIFSFNRLPNLLIKPVTIKLQFKTHDSYILDFS